MSRTTEAVKNYSAYIILAFFSFFLILVAGNEGGLGMEFPRFDTAWFFMAGKAWMNGLTPYVDFTDSKGPLLWIIYGLGYLLSPKSMHGMFIIEFLFYFGTFVLLYKAILIIIHKKNNALIGSMIMAFFFFQPWIHNEIRSEDFCQLFNALTLYCIVIIFFKKAEFRWPYFWLGVAFGSTLLIKYNIALMLLGPSAVVLLYLLVRKSGRILLALSLWIGGVAVIVFPFIIFFLIENCLKEFLNEYFFNTFQTINIQHPYSSIGESFWQRWPMVVGKYVLRRTLDWTLSIKLAVFSLFFLPFRVFETNWFRASVCLWLIAALLLSTYMALHHYLNSLAIFTVFPIIFLMNLLPGISRPFSIVAGSVVLYIVAFSLRFFPGGEFNDVKSAYEVSQDKHAIGKLIEVHFKERDRKPTIMYVRTGDSGLGLSTEILPGSRYWSQQAGATAEMKQRHIEDLYRIRPDFVSIPSDETELIDSLQKSGYQLIYTYYPLGKRSESFTISHYLFTKE